MVTLGFDASTTCVGWAFFDGTTILDAGFIDISKFETNKEKAFHVLETLGQNPLVARIGSINLEAFLSGFMGGRTSQQVIIKLARFNAIFEYILGEHWGHKINLISVSTARKAVFGKARVKGIKPKEYVKQQLAQIMPLDRWDKLNKKGKWDERNSDMYDAMVMAMASYETKNSSN